MRWFFILTFTIFGFSGFCLSMPTPNQTPLRAVFPGLPRVLDRSLSACQIRYWNRHFTRVDYEPPETATAQDFPVKFAHFFNPRQGCGTFIFSTPFVNDSPVIDDRLATKFLEFVGDYFYKSLDGAEIEAHLKPRILLYGAQKLLGREPTNEDALASLWWKLRLEGAESSDHVFHQGDAVLVGIRTFGYHGSNFTPGDFGHSSVGVRILGGDPKNDFILNPGAKTPPKYKGSLIGAVWGDAQVPNRVEVSNFWDWAELQTQVRLLNIDFRILKISRTQAKALRAMKDQIAQMNWGPFKMLTNSCAHGALDIYNTLLPIDRALSVSRFGEIAIPAAILNAASQRFDLGAKIIVMGSPATPGEKTPDGEMSILTNRRASRVYRQFVNQEPKEGAKTAFEHR